MSLIKPDIFNDDFIMNIAMDNKDSQLLEWIIRKTQPSDVSTLIQRLLSSKTGQMLSVLLQYDLPELPSRWINEK